jgi:hypothetical protein
MTLENSIIFPFPGWNLTGSVENCKKCQNVKYIGGFSMYHQTVLNRQDKSINEWSVNHDLDRTACAFA